MLSLTHLRHLNHSYCSFTRCPRIEYKNNNKNNRYFSISSVSSDLTISMSTSPTECELNVGDEIVLMEINTYSETNEGALHFDRISQVSIEEHELPPVEDVTKLRNDEVQIDLENMYGSEGATVDAEPGTLAAWGNPDYDVWAFRYVPEDGRLPITNDFFSDPLPGPAKWAYPARLKDDTKAVRVVKIKNPPDWIVNATRIQRVPNYETLVVESNVTLTHSSGTLFLRSAQSITIHGTISMYANGPYAGGTYWNHGKLASYQGLAKESSGGTGGNGALEYCGVTDCALLASGCTSGEIGTNGGGSGGHGNEAWMMESWNDHLVERRGGGGGSGPYCGGPYCVGSKGGQGYENGSSGLKWNNSFECEVYYGEGGAGGGASYIPTRTSLIAASEYVRRGRILAGTGPAMGASAGSSPAWLCSLHVHDLFQGGVTYTYDTNNFPVRDRNVTTLESCRDFCEALPRDRYMGFFDSNANDCYVFTTTGSTSCEGHDCTSNLDHVDFHSSNSVVFLQCRHEIASGTGGGPYVHHNETCCNSKGRGGGVIYLATDMLEVRGEIEARGGDGGHGGDAENLENSSYVFLDVPTEITLQDLRDVCKAHGFGWDIVSIESADQVQAIANHADSLGISLTQGDGIPLAYDKNGRNQYYNLRYPNLDVTSVFDELRISRGWTHGDYHTDEAHSSDCEGRGQKWAGFRHHMPGISDFSECEITSNSKVLCELKSVRSGSGGGSGGSGGGGGIIILDALRSSFYEESQINLRGGDGGRGGLGGENISQAGGRGGNGAPGSQGDDGVLILSGPHRFNSSTNSRSVLRNKGMILYSATPRGPVCSSDDIRIGRYDVPSLYALRYEVGRPGEILSLSTNRTYSSSLLSSDSTSLLDVTMSLWQANVNDTSQWLEIDLNSDRLIRGVIVQSGRNGGAATKIKIATGLEGQTSRIDVDTYHVSVYSEKKQYIRFETNVTARYVRIYILEFRHNVTMRADVILIDNTFEARTSTSNYTHSVSLPSNTTQDVSFGRYNTNPSNTLSLTVFTRPAITRLSAPHSTYRCPVCPPIEISDNMRVSWDDHVSRCLQNPTSRTFVDLTVDRLRKRSGRFETRERNIDVTLNQDGTITLSSNTEEDWVRGDLLVNLRHSEDNVLRQDEGWGMNCSSEFDCVLSAIHECGRFVSNERAFLVTATSDQNIQDEDEPMWLSTESNTYVSTVRVSDLNKRTFTVVLNVSKGESQIRVFENAYVGLKSGLTNSISDEFRFYVDSERPIVESLTIMNASDIWDKSHTNVLNDTVLQLNLSEPVVNMSNTAFRSSVANDTFTDLVKMDELTYHVRLVMTSTEGPRDVVILKDSFQDDYGNGNDLSFFESVGSYDVTPPSPVLTISQSETRCRIAALSKGGR